MGKKGGSTFQKRLNTPGFWKVPKKHDKYITKPSPGPHKSKECFTLTYIMRDHLKLATTAKEVRAILHEGKVKVDGKPIKDHRYPAGLMDVIEIPDIEKIYRILPDNAYYRKLVEISKDAEFKLCKVKNKTTLKKGTIQLNLHDGRNILVPVKDPIKPDEDVYKVNDVIKIDVLTQEIKKHVKFEKGKLAIVTAGVNNGRMGKIVDITKRFGPNADTVTLDDEGSTFDTSLDFVMVLGDKKPIIEFPV
ncbi:30S ribosomal protein S4e [Candidatus Bathyarchaeota archaeon]|nr:30S ribosomal protein S4e [Candidatus Bathyarchaeota archaeon]